MKVHYSSPPCEGRDSGPASTMMQRGVRPGCEVINDLPSVYTGSWAEKKMVFLLDSFPPLTFWGDGEREREKDRKVNCVWFDCVRGGKRETGTYINCQHHSLVCHNLSLVVQFSSLQLSFLSLVCVFIFFYLGNHSKDGIQWNAEGQVALGHPTVVNIRPKMTQDEDSHSLELCEPMPTLLLLRLVLFLFWLASHY